MGEEIDIKRLDTAPVTELNIGSTSFRRAIVRAGFNTLPELLNLPESKVDHLFNPNDADLIIKLQNDYRHDPHSFAVSVLKEKKMDRAGIEQTLSKARKSYGAARAKRAEASHGSTPLTNLPTVLPSAPFSNDLTQFEKRASTLFDNLSDRYEVVMVYQVFEEFSTDLDKLSESFAKLFGCYAYEPYSALNLIDIHLRNAFVVYVADKARKVYSDGNLWGNFFKDIGIHDAGAQSMFKQVFVNHINRLGMPLYARDEEANYYFYTALLHGGLSMDAWTELWGRSILPLAKKTAKGYFGFGGEMDGHSVIKLLKNPDSGFAPKKSVLNILEKAPDSTIAPLFEASMRVASQVIMSGRDRSGYTMLSSFGLPEVAMEALRENQERTTGERNRKTDSPNDKRQRGRRLVYLPNASLQLDLAEGLVFMRWPRQQFPLYFADNKIDYYVNGEKRLRSEFEVSVGKCILEPANIAVAPQTRYDVELKLIQRNEKTGEYEEVSSLHQTFTRSKPACFEFIESSRGLYRLRGRNERISRNRRIAYVLKNGYQIMPGKGMAAVSGYETSGDWGSTKIAIYDVNPGAAGSIVDKSTGAEVAVWQEQYLAKIDKRRIIGETADGIDLYGFAPCDLGTNAGLPSISIEAIDNGRTAIDDLDIVCICDGKRISIPRHELWADDSGKTDAIQIALRPYESALFDRHIEECLIEARQKSAGNRPVFRYRFAVVPIQDFRPNSIALDADFGGIVAQYAFQAVLPLKVIASRKETVSVNAWGRYTAKALLKDEFLCLRIKSSKSGKETDARLALAAIDISIPDALVRLSKKRPICLADALELGPSTANFRISSYGWRYNRAVMVMLGQEPIFFKELKQPSEHTFNLFRSAGPFRQHDDSPPNKRPLKLSLIYGDYVTQHRFTPAWSEMDVLDCMQGIGIYGWQLLTTKETGDALHFEGSPVCDTSFVFKSTITGKKIAQSSVPKGATELALPPRVSRLLDAQKTIVVEMSPSDWFGDPQQEHATTFHLKR